MGSLFNHELLKLNTKNINSPTCPNGFYHSYFSLLQNLKALIMELNGKISEKVYETVEMGFMLLGRFA